MKSRLISLFLLLGAVMFGAFSAGAEKKEAKGKPTIVFTDYVHDFGTIYEEGKPVTTKFEFVNTGDAPLLILKASASCGCTRPEYPKSPVQPGKKGVIKVTYNQKGRPGEFSKTITVRTNAKEGKYKKVVLKIKGNVIPAPEK